MKKSTQEKKVRFIKENELKVTHVELLSFFTFKSVIKHALDIFRNVLIFNKIYVSTIIYLSSTLALSKQIRYKSNVRF